jgi:hypothetical protein
MGSVLMRRRQTKYTNKVFVGRLRGYVNRMET